MILLLLAPAWAGTLSLSYPEALDRALRGNPELLGSGQDLLEAEGALLAARSILDPALTADTSVLKLTTEGEISGMGIPYTNDSDIFSMSSGLNKFFATGTTMALDYELSRVHGVYDSVLVEALDVDPETLKYQTKLAASVSQALLEGHKMSYNLAAVRSAQRGLDAADLGLFMTRQQVLADTATAYWGLYYAQRVAEIAQGTLDVATEEQRIVRARLEAGTAAPVERARVDAAVVQAQAALIDARIAALEAADALLLVVGEAPGQDVVLSTPPAEPSELNLDEAQVVEGALLNNPEVLTARLLEKSAELDLRDAAHARLPDLTATARYGLNGYEEELGAASSEMVRADLPEWFLGANLSVPLGNRADRGQYDSKAAAAARSRIEREAMERSVEQRVRAQVRTLTSAKAKVDLAAANLRLAEETLTAERARQEAGADIEKDVLQAISSVDDARVELEKARADYLLAVVELQRLRGTL